MFDAFCQDIVVDFGQVMVIVGTIDQLAPFVFDLAVGRGELTPFVFGARAWSWSSHLVLSLVTPPVVP